MVRFISLRVVTCFFVLSFFYTSGYTQGFQTVFETSAGKQTTTYPGCIAWYEKLAAANPHVKMLEMGQTDAGYPLHLILYNSEGKTDPGKWNRDSCIVILINNGIHPGEPDGIDASMLLLRDAVEGKWIMPENVIIGIIPIYNIGGALNRNQFSRVNQLGPESYGFRGNAQNLDLNRDFTKCDSRNALSFAKIFHYLNPDILVDNHVSDGADYQHVMTLLSTQYDKLGGASGNLQRKMLDPLLYRSMAKKGFPMIPYVNVESTPDNGWHAFYDPPRFSSGYAALFHCLAYVPETHMLKPFKQRVESTYAFMKTLITESATISKEIIAARNADVKNSTVETMFPLNWKLDTTRFTNYRFKGYAAKYKTSEVTGMQRLYYDRTAPYEKTVPIYDYYKADNVVKAPKAYIIPQGWYEVADLLLANGVIMGQLLHDTVMQLQAYHVDDYKTLNRAYEKHYKHYDINVSASVQSIEVHAGDYIVDMGQPANRFIVEMLEPEGEDSYFAWNFFDAILQQKEGYSDYRWEDVAAQYVKQHPDVARALNNKKQTDTSFAANAAAQLDFVYKHSPYYEPGHLRYPVYRLQ